MTGAAWGAGSLTTGALTVVSPVNGFTYSLFEVMTSRALGLKPLEAAEPAAGAAGGVTRLPRLRPEPRVVPNVPNGGVTVMPGAVVINNPILNDPNGKRALLAIINEVLTGRITGTGQRIGTGA